MNRDEVFVRHMLDAIEEINGMLQGILFVQLVNEPMRMHAVVRLFEILGEAAGKLTPEFRAKYPDIPFGDIIGMRNKLIHHYFEVDLETLWQTFQEDLPDLKAALEKTL